MKVLFVCLGNICRSPLAEGILRHRIQQQELDWSVDSAGTGHWHVGESPHEDSQRVARQKGIDITDQRARQVKPEDIAEYDLILTMDEQNYQDVLALAETEGQKEKIDMLLNYLYPGEHRSVPDPYFEGGFEGVYDMLERAIDRLIEDHA